MREITPEAYEAAVIAAQDASGFDHPYPDRLFESLEWDGAQLCIGGVNSAAWDLFPDRGLAVEAAQRAFYEYLRPEAEASYRQSLAEADAQAGVWE